MCLLSLAVERERDTQSDVIPQTTPLSLVCVTQLYGYRVGRATQASTVSQLPSQLSRSYRLAQGLLSQLLAFVIPAQLLLLRSVVCICIAFDYDPSAGSPTETLLRLLLPLSAPVRISLCRSPHTHKRCMVRQSKTLTGTLNR